MKIKHSSCKQIKNILNILSSFLEETTLLFSPDGLGIADVDISKIIFIVIKIKKEKFDTYEVDKTLKVAIQLKEIYSIFKKAKDEDSFSIESTQTCLKLNLEGDIVRRYVLPLIELDHKNSNIPVYDFSTHLKMPIEIIRQIIDGGLILSEEIAIKLENDKLGFYVQDLNKHGSFEVSETALSKITLETREKSVESRYSLTFLDKIITSLACLGSVVCNIAFGNDFPIEIQTETENLSVTFYMGPRV